MPASFLLIACMPMLACGAITPGFAAELESSDSLHVALSGRWEGALVGEFRSQDVSWHFEMDDEGQLRGYMGPSIAGMPSLRMENLVLNGEVLSFGIASQHGTFEGSIGPDGIAGVWQQGTALPLQMKKRDFVFPVPERMRTDLLGHWEIGSQTAVHLDFTETDAGLAGVLAVPSLNLRNVPLVDIFVTDEGYAQFATDNGRRFTGRLVNGVLVGEYSAPGTQQRATFSKPDQRGHGYDLELADAVRARLMGRWYTKIFGDDTVLEFFVTESDEVRAQLLFDEGPVRDDQLLEVAVDGENISYTTFGGKTFVGAFVDEGFAGEYRNNNFPVQVTFTREPQ